jgi:hypothetical protein
VRRWWWVPLLALEVLFACGWVGYGIHASPKSNVQTIYVRNVSSYVSDAEVKNALPAINSATHNDFAPCWKVDANLVFIGKAKAPVGAATMTLVDKGPVKGALAYHEVVNGVPDSIIYTGTSKYYGYSWTVGFTHELWEQLADPGLIHTAQSPDGTIWAQEVADPVESDTDAYTRAGADGKPVLISDFVTEKWFGAATTGPFDFANHVQYPLVIDKGGYAQWWDGVTWNLVDNFRSARDRGFLIAEQS